MEGENWTKHQKNVSGSICLFLCCEKKPHLEMSPRAVRTFSLFALLLDKRFRPDVSKEENRNGKRSLVKSKGKKGWPATIYRQSNYNIQRGRAIVLYCSTWAMWSFFTSLSSWMGICSLYSSINKRLSWMTFWMAAHKPWSTVELITNESHSINYRNKTFIIRVD